MTVTVPIRLGRGLNDRGHWRIKARRVKLERTAVALAWWSAVRPGTRPSLPLVVTLTRVGPRELDDDNVQGACKATRDEVARLLGLDDRDPRVTWRYAQAKGPYAVVIALEPGGSAPGGGG